MLPLIWHPEALDDLERIVDFIEAQNPPAAERIGNAIRHTAERLPDHPICIVPAAYPAHGKL